MSRFNGALKLLAGCVVMAVITSPLYAGSTRVPEIDFGIAGSAAALLVGGYLVVVSRTRRK